MITRNFFLSPASLDAQCESLEVAYSHTCKIVECFKEIAPAVVAGRYSVSCSADIDSSNLISGQEFSSTVQNFRGRDADICRLWFTYTKNRFDCDIASSLVFEIRSTDSSVSGSHIGSAPPEKLTEEFTWLSFGGTPTLESPKLDVVRSDTKTYTVQNAHTPKRLNEIIPRFEHSEKHKKYPYYDASLKENVAAMPIRDIDKANGLLRTGIPYEADFFSFDKLSQKYFRFKNTRINIYHGFEVEVSEIPSSILRRLNT